MSAMYRGIATEFTCCLHRACNWLLRIEKRHASALDGLIESGRKEQHRRVYVLGHLVNCFIKHLFPTAEVNGAQNSPLRSVDQWQWIITLTSMFQVTSGRMVSKSASNHDSVRISDYWLFWNYLPCCLSGAKAGVPAPNGIRTYLYNPFPANSLIRLSNLSYITIRRIISEFCQNYLVLCQNYTEVRKNIALSQSLVKFICSQITRQLSGNQCRCPRPPWVVFQTNANEISFSQLHSSSGQF